MEEALIRCDWARNGLEAIGRGAAVVIVDVFSFGTAVTLAVERGASVYAWPGDAAGDAGFAAREQAILCADRSRTTFSLSPESLLRVERGTRLVLPSLNGAQSSEARSAAAAFSASREQIAEILGDSVSGRELVARGFSADVALAADYDVSAVVPVAGRDGWLCAAAVRLPPSRGS